MDLNTFINESRKHWSKSNEAKRAETEFVYYSVKKQKLKPINKPCFIIYYWYCKGKHKDKSNVAFAKKFIEDGLQEAGIIKNDGWSEIVGFRDYFEVDRLEPRVEVFIAEGGEVLP